jgi:cyclopropane fatty-acyl-phospholipid synthase-like methyltransferase
VSEGRAGPEHSSESGEYWKRHAPSWEASAYYQDRQTEPSLLDRTSAIFRGRLMYQRMEEALTLVSPHVQGLRVLDLGCASGRFAFELVEAGAEHVVGVDVSSEVIAAAEAQRAQHPAGDRLEFKVLDVTHPGATLPEVDLVTALGVIEYFDPTALSDLLGKLDTRYILLEFPDSDQRRRNRLQWYLRQVYLRVNRCPGVYLYTPEEFQSIAAECGFENVRYEHRSGFDYATNLPRR